MEGICFVAIQLLMVALFLLEGNKSECPLKPKAGCSAKHWNNKADPHLTSERGNKAFHSQSEQRFSFGLGWNLLPNRIIGVPLVLE